MSTIYYPSFLNLFPPPMKAVKTHNFSKLLPISRYMFSRCNETVLYYLFFVSARTNKRHHHQARASEPALNNCLPNLRAFRQQWQSQKQQQLRRGLWCSWMPSVRCLQKKVKPCPYFPIKTRTVHHHTHTHWGTNTSTVTHHAVRRSNTVCLSVCLPCLADTVW